MAHIHNVLQGLPLPPINFHEELNLNSDFLNITFIWQPPLGLVIDDDLMYVININASIQNLTDQLQFPIEVVTSNLSYTTEIVFKETFNISQLCILSSHLSYDIVHNIIVDISLSSKNKVGMGMEVYKEIVLDLLCPSTIIPITTSGSG